MEKDLDYYLSQVRRISAHREAGAEKEIRRLYKSMLKDLQQFMSETYIQYAKDDKLTYAILQEAGYNARFLEEVEQRLNITTPKASKMLRELVEETYKSAYEGMVDGVAKASDDLETVFAESVAITPEQIKRAVENPVNGLTLSDTLERHRKDIIYSIKQTVGVGLMNGDRYTTMAKRIAQQVDGDYKKAIRIARTETHRVREAGNHDAALGVDTELQKGTTGMRMCKTWKTMKDERVRPQRRKKGKKGWSTKMGKGANHIKLDGQTVLATEPFDLLDGNTATAPGNSGVAGHDINCRCYVSYEMLTDAEYFAASGKHFPGWKKAEEKHEPTSEKHSTVDTSNIKAKKLKQTVEEAFNDIKQRDDLIDVDTVLTHVKYAEGAKEKNMLRLNAGAMVEGKTLYIARPYAKYIDRDFIMHEIGHKVTRFGSKMTDATAKRIADEMMKELRITSFKGMASYVSDYACKSPVEFFPECFMEYMNGKELRGNKKKIIELAMRKIYFTK